MDVAAGPYRERRPAGRHRPVERPARGPGRPVARPAAPLADRGRGRAVVRGPLGCRHLRRGLGHRGLHARPRRRGRVGAHRHRDEGHRLAPRGPPVRRRPRAVGIVPQHRRPARRRARHAVPRHPQPLQALPLGGPRLGGGPGHRRPGVRRAAHRRPRTLRPLVRAGVEDAAVQQTPARRPLAPVPGTPQPAAGLRRRSERHDRLRRQTRLRPRGDGIRVHRADGTVTSNGQEYRREGLGRERVWQQYHELPDFPGARGSNHPVLGSWVVDDEAYGVGIRESDGPITDYYCRFARTSSRAERRRFRMPRPRRRTRADAHASMSSTPGIHEAPGLPHLRFFAILATTRASSSSRRSTYSTPSRWSNSCCRIRARHPVTSRRTA